MNNQSPLAYRLFGAAPARDLNWVNDAEWGEMLDRFPAIREKRGEWMRRLGKDDWDDVSSLFAIMRGLADIIDAQTAQIERLLNDHEPRIRALEQKMGPAPEPTIMRTWLVKANIVGGDWKGTITAPADLDRVALENHFIAALGETLGEKFLYIRTYYDANDGSYEPPMSKGGDSK